MTTPAAFESELADFVADTYADPLAFVMGAYPWGEPGPLRDFDGPDDWQRDFLIDLGKQIKDRKFDGHTAVMPIRKAVSKGHGVGGSALIAWLCDFIMSTRVDAQGTITANTMTQLQTKTWAAIQRWTSLCITGHWFTMNAERMYYTNRKATWFCSPQSSREENYEAFAGQHQVSSTSFYLCDESSAIPRKIIETAEGGMTDGEAMIFMLGNMTRRDGPLYDAVFGKNRHRWTSQVVDSRTSRFTNKAQIEEWRQDYGEDSDFFRVRVLGLAPNASDAQFIDQGRVREAQKRKVVVLPDEPLIAGCDLAWGGDDKNVIRFRRGNDAKSIPAIRIPGEFTRDPSVLTNRLSDVMSRDYDHPAGKCKVSMLFLDSAGIAGPIGQRLRSLGFHNIMEVNFGADSPSDKCRFMRDYMWSQMKDWLLAGSIDDYAQLESDLTNPGLRPETRQRVWLESKEDMKKRGVSSPDEGDALALTFAAPVKPPHAAKKKAPFKPSSPWG